MYTRSNPNGFVRFIGGAIIVIGAVGLYLVYQYQMTPRSSAPQPSVTAPATLPAILATPGPSATPVPPTLRIVSAKAQLSAVIVELYLSRDTDNWDLTQLTTFAGHLQGTAAIKHGGNFVLAGHVEMKDGSQGPFAMLDQLKKGDPITIVSDQPGNPVVMQYTVTGVDQVDPNDFDVLRNHGYEELTLITCADWSPQDQSYHTRVVVHARPTKAGA